MIDLLCRCRGEDRKRVATHVYALLMSFDGDDERTQKRKIVKSLHDLGLSHGKTI